MPLYVKKKAIIVDCKSWSSY